MVNGVVTSEAESVAREIEDQLEARDIQGIGLLALAGATGVIVAQEITERVLPLLNMPREPTSAVQFAAAGGIKMAFALLIGGGAAAMGLTGLPLVFLAFHAVGAIVFAGADFVNALQRGGALAESAQRSSQPTSAKRSSQPTPAQSSGGSGNRSQPGRNGSAGQSLFDVVSA